MLTNTVRAFCLLVDVGVIALAGVALVRWHRAGMARVRGVTEPPSNVTVLRPRADLMQMQDRAGEVICRLPAPPARVPFRRP